MMRRPAFIARQASRPSGLLGRMLLRVMARETSRFNLEILQSLAPAAGEHILEIGYGHGAALMAAAAVAPDARLSGIDISVDAGREASRRCHALLGRGSLDLRVGDSAALPWDAGVFDKAFSVNTLYFWSDPTQDLGEIRRVLRDQGRLVIGFREHSEAAASSFPSPIYRFHTIGELTALLEAAGFHAIDVHEAAAGRGLWIMVASAR
jgi:ubiquinone/menaquinone biosynthesis C-methylase UbiE